MQFKSLSLASMLFLTWCFLTSAHGLEADPPPWVVYEGQEGPGRGMHVVLISGDEEYRSEETLPQLGKILARHHGFRCSVLFAIDPKTGVINPEEQKNIPGLEALKSADLMILFTRFRDLPDEQMRHIHDYVQAGKPVIGLRTATHGFQLNQSQTFALYDWRSKANPGGFGRSVLGETWISHHGHHGKQSTRGLIIPEQAQHPIVRGIKDGDVWGPTDVYGVRLPMPRDCTPLLWGQVLEGMKPDDPPVTGEKNQPMMPIAWIKTQDDKPDHPKRVFTTTMGASQDLQSAGLRRLLVNAVYWAVGMEDRIDGQAKVDLVGEFKPSGFSFGGYRKGVRPQDHELK